MMKVVHWDEAILWLERGSQGEDGFRRRHRNRSSYPNQLTGYFFVSRTKLIWHHARPLQCLLITALLSGLMMRVLKMRKRYEQWVKKWFEVAGRKSKYSCPYQHRKVRLESTFTSQNASKYIMRMFSPNFQHSFLATDPILINYLLSIPLRLLFHHRSDKLHSSSSSTSSSMTISSFEFQ